MQESQFYNEPCIAISVVFSCLLKIDNRNLNLQSQVTSESVPLTLTWNKSFFILLLRTVEFIWYRGN